MPVLTVGLLADTHLPHRMRRLPDLALEALAGVDLILHAGDVDSVAALAPLRAIAPVHAVRGNVHLQDFSDGGAALPDVVRLQLAGQDIVLTHGHISGALGFLTKAWDIVVHGLNLVGDNYINRYLTARLARLYPEADVIVFGHSHRACVERVGRTLLVNPGAVCPTKHQRQTVARMRLGDGRPRVQIIPL